MTAAQMEPDPFTQVLLDEIIKPSNTSEFRSLYFQKNIGAYSEGKPDLALSTRHANLVGSRDLPSGMHLPVIDLDFPCILLDSTTPGHHHLYMQRPVEADKYFAMLDAMADAGVVERGFARMSRAKGQSFAVRPGLRHKDRRKNY